MSYLEDFAAAMSRRADAPDGKLTARLDVQVSEDLDETLIAMAKLMGFQNKSELVRDVLHRFVYGEWDAIRLKMRALDRNTENSR